MCEIQNCKDKNNMIYKANVSLSDISRYRTQYHSISVFQCFMPFKFVQHDYVSMFHNQQGLYKTHVSVFHNLAFKVCTRCYMFQCFHNQAFKACIQYLHVSVFYWEYSPAKLNVL